MISARGILECGGCMQPLLLAIKPVPGRHGLLGASRAVRHRDSRGLSDIGEILSRVIWVTRGHWDALFD